MTSSTSSGRCSRSARRACTNASSPPGAGVSVASGSPGAIVPVARSASMTATQKRVASVSSRSTSTQAIAPRAPAVRSHDASSIVLPLPAGAQTRVTGPAVPRSSSANSRGRSTTPGASHGAAGPPLLESASAARVGAVFVAMEGLGRVHPMAHVCPRARRARSGDRDVLDLRLGATLAVEPLDPAVEDRPDQQQHLADEVGELLLELGRHELAQRRDGGGERGEVLAEAGRALVAPRRRGPPLRRHAALRAGEAGG